LAVIIDYIIWHKLNKENGVQVLMVMFSRNHHLTWITKHHFKFSRCF